MNDYEAKKQARVDRYRQRAERARQEAESRHKAAEQIMSHIPPGQPILIGHHSEKRHRRDLDRIDNNIGKAVQASKKAKYWDQRAAGAESNHAISSDDPEAIAKLKERISECERECDGMKSANQVIRRKPKYQPTDDKVRELMSVLDVSESTARKLFEPDVCGWIGFPPFTMGNRRANIRRMKQRLSDLEALEQRRHEMGADDDSEQVIEHRPDNPHGAVIVENIGMNRLQIRFPGKPAEDVRQNLKRHGFRWCRSELAWQRHLSNGAKYWAEVVIGAA